MHNDMPDYEVVDVTNDNAGRSVPTKQSYSKSSKGNKQVRVLLLQRHANGNSCAMYPSAPCEAAHACASATCAADACHGRVPLQAQRAELGTFSAMEAEEGQPARCPRKRSERQKNWPRCWPLVYCDIAYDMPPGIRTRIARLCVFHTSVSMQALSFLCPASAASSFVTFFS